MRNLKTFLCTAVCAVMVAGSAMTVNAEDLSEAEKQNLAFKDCPVTQVTPGGVNIYGYESMGVNPLTGEMLSADWSETYINAIDAAGITNEMSDYDKAVAIANYLCSALEYGKASDALYGDTAIREGRGVCANYANAFENLCCMVNVECYTVGGSATNAAGTDGHEWNEVHVGGQTYYTDVTWLDTGRKSSEYLMSPVEWSDHHRIGSTQDQYTQEYWEGVIGGALKTARPLEENDPFWSTQNMDELEWYDMSQTHIEKPTVEK